MLPTGGVAVADDATYSIRILDSAGAVLRILRRPIEPRRVTAGDRERERDRRAARLAERGGLRLVGPQAASLPPAARQAMAQPLDEADFARVMPVIRRIAADPAGNLWVERTGPSLDQPAAVDVLIAQGRYLGSLRGWELPAAFSPGGRVAFVREDALGVQRVVVMRVRLAAPRP